MNLDKIADAFLQGATDEGFELAEDSGLTHIGTGSRRYVFEVPGKNTVVKFSGGNVVENKREAEAWREAPADLRPALLPVEQYATDYSWIIMPKAQPVSVSPADMRTLRDKFRESDWNCKDKNPENIGRYQGELVLFDYGLGCGPGGFGKKY